LREVAGLTLRELADRSELAASTAHKRESGRMTPSVAVVLKMAHGLGRSASERLQESVCRADIIHVLIQSRIAGAGERR